MTDQAQATDLEPDGEVVEQADGQDGQGQAAPTWGERLSVVDWHRVSMWASFLVPLALSIGANVAYALGIGSVVWFLAGLFIPLLLVFAIERWRNLPAGVKGWKRAARVAGVAIVAAIAAGITWRHTAVLLLEQYPHWIDPFGHGHRAIDPIDWWLCTLAPLASDGLAVVSIMALRSADAAQVDPPAGKNEGGDQGDQGDEGDGDDEQDDEQDEPRPPTKMRTRTDLRAAARALNERHGYKIVQDQPVADLRRAVENAERDVRTRQAAGQGDGQTGTDGGQAP